MEKGAAERMSVDAGVDDGGTKGVVWWGQRGRKGGSLGNSVHFNVAANP